MLKGRRIVLGVTGGIACYKACEIVSRLKKLGADIKVVMTKNSQNFVAPLSFETLSNNPVVTDTFKRDNSWEVEHISLAKFAEIIVIAPATANIIGKVASGICDDMLTTTIMASKAKILFCPAMNTSMYNNVIYRENEKKLRALGYKFVDPTIGWLACGDTGAGKMSEPIDIVHEIEKILTVEQDLQGKMVTITCGGTQEPIDPVRCITNHSSGKMGMAIANECISRGANVTLICGSVSVPIVQVDKVVNVKTTVDMYNATLGNIDGADYIIMAAAPSDYRVENVADNKIKSQDLTLKLTKNPDIAATVGNIKGKSKLVIFSAETQDLLNNAMLKLEKKGADMVVANDVTKVGAGFGADTNIVTIINNKGEVESYDIMSKAKVAEIIVDSMQKL